MLVASYCPEELSPIPINHTWPWPRTHPWMTLWRDFVYGTTRIWSQQRHHRHIVQAQLLYLDRHCLQMRFERHISIIIEVGGIVKYMVCTSRFHQQRKEDYFAPLGPNNNSNQSKPAHDSRVEYTQFRYSSIHQLVTKNQKAKQSKRGITFLLQVRDACKSWGYNKPIHGPIQKNQRV